MMMVMKGEDHNGATLLEGQHACNTIAKGRSSMIDDEV